MCTLCRGHPGMLQSIPKIHMHRPPPPHIQSGYLVLNHRGLAGHWQAILEDRMCAEDLVSHLQMEGHFSILQFIFEKITLPFLHYNVMSSPCCSHASLRSVRLISKVDSCHVTSR